MIRIGVLTCVWQRKELAAICLDYLAMVRDELLKNGIELVVVIPGSEADVSSKLVLDRGFHYIEMTNAQLGAKWNAGMQALRWFDPAGVVILGSDDFLTPQIYEFAAQALAGGALLGGFLDLHYLAPGPRAIFWPGYKGDREGEPIGCGRFMAASLLDRVSWRPWPDSFQKSLDSASWKLLRPLVPSVAITSMVANGRMFDVKAHMDVDLSRFDSYAVASTEVDFAVVTSCLPQSIQERLTVHLASIMPARVIQERPRGKPAVVVGTAPEDIRRCIKLIDQSISTVRDPNARRAVSRAKEMLLLLAQEKEQA